MTKRSSRRVGTSAVVRPAASLPLVAKHGGAVVVEANTEYTAISALIDGTILGQAGETLPALVDALVGLRESRGNTPRATRKVSERAGS